MTNCTPRLIGNSPAIRQIRKRIEAYAQFAEPVLIVGETGTGKDVVARAVHAASPRRQRRFHALNCAGIPMDVLAAELFGHTRGAFTGATTAREGRLLAAAGSTLLLDEITEAPVGLQTSLLRTLETGELQRLGDDHLATSDVRLLAATNRPWSELEAGALRADLFHRLAGLVLQIPPLRERPEDIAPLAAMFLEQLATGQADRPRLTPAALRRLEEAPLPGNARELRQVILRAVALQPSGRIDAQLISDCLLSGRAPDCADEGRNVERRTLARLIQGHIEDALDAARGNISDAARRLDVPRSTLQHYLIKYDIDRDQSRTRSA